MEVNAETTLKNHVGLSMAFISQPFGALDPYSWSFGGGVYFERRLTIRSRPWILGARMTYLATREREDLYGASRMLMVGETLGTRFGLDGSEGAVLALIPALGFHQYWRWFEHSGATYTTSRPVVSALGTVEVNAIGELSFGLTAEMFLVFEQQPVLAIGQNLRLGMRF
jgi:hypothetical protein